MFRLFSLAALVCLFTSLAGALSAQDVQTTQLDDNEPDQMSLLDDDWELKVGDRVIYEVLEEREEPILLTVNGNGELLLPLIGLVKAEGKTSQQLAYEIREELEVDFFHRATVAISQREEDRNRGRVTVIGEVNRPGEQLIPPDAPLTLSQAILLGGGFSSNANRADVSLVRGAPGSQQAVKVDVGAMHETGDFRDDQLLLPGDVIIVGREDQLGKQIYVLGAVESPGLYPTLGNKITLSQAILMADGFTRFAKKSKVRLITTDSNGERRESVVNVGKVLDSGDRTDDPEVKPGDMIIVDEKMISFTG